MGPSFIAMDRRGHNRRNISVFPSGSKIPSSKNKHHKNFKRLGKGLLQKHPRPNTSNSNRDNPSTNHSSSRMSNPSSSRMLPIAPKSPITKRPRDYDWSVPFEKPIWSPTGLEEMDGPPTKKLQTTITEAELESYNDREPTIKEADKLRKRRILAKRVSSSWENMPTSSQRGMPNLTLYQCYRHSLFQSLLHMPAFVNFIQTFHHEDLCVSDDKTTCVSCWLRRLSLEYWNVSPSPTKLGRILGAIETLFHTLGWRPDVAHFHADPEEQSEWITKFMEQELPTDVFEYYKSCFLFGIYQVVQCDKCASESYAKAEDQYLPIPIDRVHREVKDGHLMGFLDNYLIDIVEGYRCEICGDNKDEKYRFERLSYSPKNCLIHLKRFDWEGHKINNVVRIPTTLDLNPYRDVSNRHHLRYELTAVIKHSGNLRGGHYFCSAKDSDGNWYRFDDERVSRCSVAQVTRPSEGGFTPYLLYYERMRQ